MDEEQAHILLTILERIANSLDELAHREDIDYTRTLNQTANALTRLVDEGITAHTLPV